MLKKIILACVLTGTAASAASALSLEPFAKDFDTLMKSVAHDVAPTLRLGALAGDLQGDATIDHFDFTGLGLGFNLADGLGTALRPGATPWTFVVPMDSFSKDLPSWFQHVMLYPSFKLAFGMAVGGGWDFTLSGNYLPAAASGFLFQSVSGDKGVPQLGYSNIGLNVRKTLLKDTGAMNTGPALSLGAGYHFSSFHFGLDTKGWIPDVDLGDNNIQTTTGDIAFDAGSQVVTLDLHVSKHFAFFTPFAKLTGAYQNTTFKGNADLAATTTKGDSTAFVSKPSVNLSDFAFLTTVGFDLDLLIMHFNLNVIADLSRAKLNIGSFNPNDIDANAFSLNTGLHWAF